jgi:hypothetical protein
VKRARFAVLLLLASVVPASAQTESRFAAGASFVFAGANQAPSDDVVHSGVYVEPLWRFGDIEPGWGPHWGLNWYSVDIDRTLGANGTPTVLGELHIKPIMVGYGYNLLRGKDAFAFNLLGGYAFSSFDLSSAASDAFARLGTRATDASAANTWVLKPEVDIWHDINKLFGLNINVGYMIARPEVTVNTVAGADRRTARADQFLVKVGLVYSIF